MQALTAPGAPFEVVTEKIRDVEFKMFSTAYKNLREVYLTSLDKEGFIAKRIIENYGDQDWVSLVYKDESYTFTESYRIASTLAWRLHRS